MKSNNLLRRIAVFLMSMAITLSYMPASFYAYAQDGEEAVSTELKTEAVVEAPQAEEKIVEPEKKEELKVEEKAEMLEVKEVLETKESLEAKEMQQVVKEEAAVVIEAEAVQTEAEEVKVVEEAAAEQEPVKPAVTLAKTICVTYHFYQKNADGEYVEARSIKKSVTSGNSTAKIALSTANSYVKNTKLSGEGNMVTEFTKTWSDAKGNAPAFPLTMSYEEAGSITEDGKSVDVKLYAEYATHPASINLTIRYSGIMSSKGEVADKESASSLGWGSGSTIKLKKLESNTGVVKGNSMYADFTYNGKHYVYTGEWEATDGNGNSFTVDSATSISVKAAAGGINGTDYKIDKDLTLTFTPVYDITDLPGLDLNYIDNVSTGSGSWSNKDANGVHSAFTSLTHEFSDPSVKSPELSKHYRFLYWEDDETEEKYAAGEKITITAGEGIKKVSLHAWWQPSVTVNYYVNGKLAESKESFDEIAAYSYEPEMEGAEFIGWYAGSEEDADRIAEDASYEAPAITKIAVDQKIINLYAKFATSYKIEHYLEQLDGSYALDEEASEILKDIVIGSLVKADEKEFEGYTFDASAADTIKEAAVEVGLAFKLFYALNTHTVNYEYTGSLIPEGAMEQLPASATYKYGEMVTAADIPAMEGYTFSGWTGEVSSMPDKDVTVTGSWKINSHKVTYSYTGNIPADAPAVPEETTYEYGAAVSAAEIPAMEGYTFSGWTGEVSSMPDRDITVTGSWKINSHKVRYEYAGKIPADAPAAPGEATYEYGAAVSAADIPSIEGYTFSGWTGEVSSMPDRDVTVTGNWQINSYKVTYEYTGEIPADAPAVPEEATYEYGAAVAAAEIPTMKGYTFSGWTGEVESMPAENVVVSGSWTKVILPAAVANEDDNNTATPVAGKIAETATIVEEAVPAAAPAAEMINIADNKTPLAEGTWALLNLIAAVMTALGAIIAIFRRKEEDENADEDDNISRRMFAAKAAGILTAIAAVITFILTEDMSLQMVLADGYTLLMAAMLAVQAVSAAFCKKASEADDEESTDANAEIAMN